MAAYARTHHHEAQLRTKIEAARASLGTAIKAINDSYIKATTAYDAGASPVDVHYAQSVDYVAVSQLLVSAIETLLTTMYASGDSTIAGSPSSSSAGGSGDTGMAAFTTYPSLEVPTPHMWKVGLAGGVKEVTWDNATHKLNPNGSTTFFTQDTNLGVDDIIYIERSNADTLVAGAAGIQQGVYLKITTAPTSIGATAGQLIINNSTAPYKYENWDTDPEDTTLLIRKYIDASV